MLRIRVDHSHIGRRAQRAVRTSFRISLVGTLLATALAGGAAADASCAPSDHPGGDWPSYGHDLANTMSQPDESVISTTNVGTLAPAWTFSPRDSGGTGRIMSTPVIAEGCVYITTESGYIYALNADLGDVVWGGRYAEKPSGTLGSSVALFAPTVHDGVLYANVSSNPHTADDQGGPYVIAVDAHSGERIWRSDSVTDANDTVASSNIYTNASAVYFDGMLIIGISNAESGLHQVGGFAVIDAATGAIIKRTRTISDEEFERGFGGGAIWTTAAVDTESGYGFAGTGQPATPDRESDRSNAILKFDLDRTRPTFGEIVDAYKGDPDQRKDIDFGASPTLYRDANGTAMVTEYQKSGYLHAASTRHMNKAWATMLSPVGAPAGNYSTTATDGTNIFGVGAFPGQIFSINGTTGAVNWANAVVTPFGANPVAYANGVVYHADGKGVLDIYDAATGLPLAMRPMSADVGSACTNIGGGLAVARNTVYSVCGDGEVSTAYFGVSDGPSGWLIAYRPTS